MFILRLFHRKQKTRPFQSLQLPLIILPTRILISSVFNTLGDSILWAVHSSFLTNTFYQVTTKCPRYLLLMSRKRAQNVGMIKKKKHVKRYFVRQMPLGSFCKNKILIQRYSSFSTSKPPKVLRIRIELMLQYYKTRKIRFRVQAKLSYQPGLGLSDDHSAIPIK